MSGINLTFSYEKEKLPIGSSKFLGNPDVWDTFEWPQFIENDESYDLTFICQINCAEAEVFYTDEILPRSGMLYFFYDMDEMPLEVFDESSARVIYYEGDTSSLFEMLRTDHEGNDMSFGEMRIHFDTQESADKAYHARLSVSFLQESEWLLLLQINSYETEKVSIKFADEATLCFFICKAEFERRNFSDIHIRQINPADEDENYYTE